MKRELAEEFNREVDGFRKALLFYARKSDWEEFKAKAGRMFDYVETIEYSELERRFFTIFGAILVILVMAVAALFGFDFGVSPELMRLKNLVILTFIAASSFELYFFIDFKRYVDVRTSCRRRRREDFIKNIEQDFRGYGIESERMAA